MNKNGFTLIELIVVLAIMSIIGIVSLANYKALIKDQSLINTTADLTTFLRLAQSNAKSSVKCGPNRDTESKGWGVYFDSNKKDFRMYCFTAIPTTFGSGQLDKTFSLNNTNISVNSTGCLLLPFQVEYSSLYGKVGFRTGPNSSDYSTCTNVLEIQLINSKDSSTKSLLINIGGSIDVQ